MSMDQVVADINTLQVAGDAIGDATDVTVESTADANVEDIQDEHVEDIVDANVYVCGDIQGEEIGNRDVISHDEGVGRDIVEAEFGNRDAIAHANDAGRDIVEADSDHGSVTTDARLMGCLGKTAEKAKYEDFAATPTVNITLDVYDMTHKYRGHALLINNERFSTRLKEQGLGNRTGSRVDEKNLQRRLNDLGFRVTVYPDLTANQMRNVCSKMAANDHSECDCFVCVILSHGEEGLVYGTDKTVEIKALTRYYKGDVCASLVGKPKLFIIQACRGYQTDPGVSVNVIDAKGKAPDDKDMPVTEPEMVKLPIEADFMFAYSTVPGYYSWRNGMNGSWFIQALCDTLEAVGKIVEIRKLLTLVNKKVAQNFKSMNPDNEDFHNMKQIPCITSMLTKDVFFSTKKRKKIM